LTYDLIAIDMDGTLLNSDGRVSDRTRETVRLAIGSGAHVVLSTGRILRSALNHSKDLNMNKAIIAANGAIVIDEKQDIIYEQKLSKEMVAHIIEIGEKNNMYYQFYGKDVFYSNAYLKEATEFYKNRDPRNSTEIGFGLIKDKEEILEDNEIDIYKFLFLDKDIEKISDVRKQLSELKDISISSSWSNNVEIMHKEVSKGNSLKHLCEKMDIPRERVIAIGDNENDLSMLEYAGLSVAMGNGEEFVKSKADIITDTNDEDGVSKIIDKYILYR